MVDLLIIDDDRAFIIYREILELRSEIFIIADMSRYK